jgi:hypothetical protein
MVLLSVEISLLSDFSLRNFQFVYTPHHLWANCLENVGASTSLTCLDIYDLLQGLLYVFFVIPLCLQSVQYIQQIV